MGSTLTVEPLMAEPAIDSDGYYNYREYILYMRVILKQFLDSPLMDNNKGSDRIKEFIINLQNDDVAISKIFKSCPHFEILNGDTDSTSSMNLEAKIRIRKESTYFDILAFIQNCLKDATDPIVRSCTIAAQDRWPSPTVVMGGEELTPADRLFADNLPGGIDIIDEDDVERDTSTNFLLSRTRPTVRNRHKSHEEPPKIKELVGFTARLPGEEKYTLEIARDLPFDGEYYYLLDTSGGRICCISLDESGHQIRNYELEEHRPIDGLCLVKEEYSHDYLHLLVRRYRSYTVWKNGTEIFNMYDLSNFISVYLKRIFYSIVSHNDDSYIVSPADYDIGKYYVEKVLRDGRVYLKCMTASAFNKRFNDLFIDFKFEYPFIAVPRMNDRYKSENSASYIINNVFSISNNVVHLDRLLDLESSVIFDHKENFFSNRSCKAIFNNLLMYDPLIKKDPIKNMCDSLKTFCKFSGDDKEVEMSKYIPEFETFLRGKKDITKK